MGQREKGEGKLPRPPRGLEEEAFVAVLRAADRMERRLTEMLKPHGLSPTQYNMLRILRGAGPEGLPCREVGERMISRDPDITRLVERMKKRGLVSRSRSTRDRRVITARITPQGMQLVGKLDQPIEEFQRQLLGHMGNTRLQQLIELLEAARSPDAAGA